MFLVFLESPRQPVIFEACVAYLVNQLKPIARRSFMALQDYAKIWRMSAMALLSWQGAEGSRESVLPEDFVAVPVGKAVQPCAGQRLVNEDHSIVSHLQACCETPSLFRRRKTPRFVATTYEKVIGFRSQD